MECEGRARMFISPCLAASIKGRSQTDGAQSINPSPGRDAIILFIHLSIPVSIHQRGAGHKLAISVETLRGKQSNQFGPEN